MPSNPASWTQATWFIDPQNSSGQASDRNTGLNSSHPLLTWAEVVGRMGTTSPYLAQVTTFTFLSGQSANVDPIFFTPRLANGSQAILLGTLTQIADIPTCGTVTPKSIGAPGTLLQVASMPGGAAAKQLVLNVTRSSYAFIDSMVSTTATMSQPIQATFITTPQALSTASNMEDNTWTTGDHLTLYTCCTLNLKNWRPTGGDQVSAGVTTACVGWVQFIHIPVGNNNSTYVLNAYGQPNIMSACQIDGALTLSSESNTKTGAMTIGCDVEGSVGHASGVSGSAGGIIRTGGVIGHRSFFSNDIILHGQWLFRNTACAHGSAIGGTDGVYSDGTWLLDFGGTVEVFTKAWGSFTVTVNPNAAFHNNSGNTWATSLLTTGTLKLGASTTGYVLNTSGVMTGPFTINSANLDTNSGLVDPITGARFCLTTGVPVAGGTVPAGSLAPGTADQLFDTNHAGTTAEWFTLGGDATFASHNLTVTGLKGNTLPSLSAGYLEWNGSAWIFGPGGSFQPASWSVTDWYLDGVSGNDANAGTTSGAPVKTIMGGIVAKWGTTSPVLSQTTTIHVLVGQASNLERAVLTPTLVGANTNFVIVGTPATVGGFFGAGTVTLLSEGNPGNDLQIASMPGGTVAGQLVFNSTKNAYAIIDSMSGSTATMCQPFAASDITTPKIISLPSFGTNWQIGDQIQISNLPTLNLSVLSPQGGDTNTGFTGGVCWTQFIHVPDVSGTNGDSSVASTVAGLAEVFSACVFDAFLDIDTNGTGFPCVVFASMLNGGGLFAGPSAQIVGGTSFSNMDFSSAGQFGAGGFYREPIAHGSVNVLDGTLFINSLHIIGTLSTNLTAGIQFGIHPIWGAGTIQNGGIISKSASTWAANILVASIQADTLTTGYASAPGYEYGPFLLTPANLDTYGGLHRSNGTVFSNGPNAVPSVPVTWSQTTWFVDPANSSGNASDNNAGSTSGAPLLTLAGLASKMGTVTPIIKQATTVTMLSDDTVSDPWTLQPEFVLTSTGSTPAGGSITVVGTLVSTGSATIGTFTPQNHTTTQNTITASGHTGAFWTPFVGNLVHDVTANAWFWVTSDNGTATANISEPLSASVNNPAYTTIANGDSLSIFRPSNIYIPQTNYSGIDSGFAGVVFQTLSLIGTSTITNAPLSTSFDRCYLGVKQMAGFIASGANGQVCTNCYQPSGSSLVASGFIYGGAYQGTVLPRATSFYDYDTVYLGSVIPDQRGCQLILGGVGMFGTFASALGINPINVQLYQLAGGSRAPVVWGTASFDVNSGSTLQFSSGSTVVSQWKSSGALTLDGSSLASAFIPTTDTWHSKIAVSPASIDSWGEFSSPTSAARIFGGSAGIPAVPPTWTQTDWYLDGSAGNDNNPGTIGSPIKTITGGLISRWGTKSPTLSQTTTVHVLTSQSANLERVNISPILNGTTTNFAIVGTPTNIGGTFTSGTVTAKSPGNPGNDLQIASMPGGSAAGDLVFNVTRQSYAFIKSMSGSIATMEQPFGITGVTTPRYQAIISEVNSWTTGDTLQRSTVPTLNLETLTPTGGDVDSGLLNGTVWVQMVRIPDASGTASKSNFTIRPTGCVVGLSMCWIDPCFTLAAQDSGVLGFTTTVGCHIVGSGKFSSGAIIQGGSLLGTVYTMWTGSQVISDTIVEGVLEVLSGNVGFGCHLDTGSQIYVQTGLASTQSPIWGAGTINVDANGEFRNTLGTFVSNIPIATLQLNGGSLGSAFVATTDTWHSNLAITLANLDAWGTLQHPDTGARIVGGAGPTTPPSWTQTDWYLDGAAGNDNNPGTIGSPIKTIMGGLVPRWGTQSPTLAQTVNLHVIAGQSVGLERAIISPRMTGTATNFVVLGSLGFISSFTAGTVTAKSPTNPGNDLQIASIPGSPAAGQLIFNLTRQSYAFIKSMSGTTAIMEQPFGATGVTTPKYQASLSEDNSWLTGDSLQLNTVPTLNLQEVTPSGGDTDSGLNNGVCWISFVHIPDVSGSTAKGNLTAYPSGCALAFSMCSIDPTFNFSGVTGPLAGLTTTIGCHIVGWTKFSNNVLIQGGSLLGLLCNISNGCQVTADTIVESICECTGGTVTWTGVHVDSGAMIWGLGGVLSAQGTIWGAGTVNIDFNTMFRLASGGTWTNTLKVATIQINGNANASSYVPGTNTWSSTIPITTTNLDAWGTLQNPDTGAIITNGGTPPAVPPSWTQAVWYLNGSTGNDLNDGSSGSPIATVMGGIITKWGTASPILSTHVEILVVGSQSTNQERIVISPVLSGPSSSLVISGSAIAVGSSFNAATVIAKSQTNPGNDLKLTGMPGGAAFGMAVINLSKNSWAWIVSISGSTATMTQPIIASALSGHFTAVEDNSWSHTDNLQLVNYPTLNICSITPTGGDTTSAGAGGFLWVQGIVIPDGSGVSNATSQTTVAPIASTVVFDICSFAADVVLNGASATGVACINCVSLGNVHLLGGGQGGENVQWLGGILAFAAGGSVLVNGGSLLDDDVIVQGTLEATDCFIGNCHLETTLTLIGGVMSIGISGGILWGGGTVDVLWGATCHLSGFFTSSMPVASVLLNGASTASAYVAATNTWHSTIPVTLANLDAWGGLLDPKSGAAYSGSSPPTVPPSWGQNVWFLDGSAGNDLNDGANVGTPVKTVMGGIVTKWGTASPVITAQIEILVQVGQAVGLERIVISPVFSGGNGNLVIIGTNTQGSTWSPSTVTAKSPGNPGSDLVLNGVPSGALSGVGAGTPIVNVTKASTAFVYSVSGTNVTVTQPFNPVSITQTPSPTQDNTWSHTDQFAFGTFPVLNIESITPIGGDTTNTGTGAYVWIQAIDIPDAIGFGTSTLSFRPQGGAALTINWCQVASNLTLNSQDSSQVWGINTATAGSTALIGGGAGTGQTNCNWIGGTLGLNNTPTTVWTDNPTIQGDTIIPSLIQASNANVLQIHAIGMLVCIGGVFSLHNILWGNVTVNVLPGATFHLLSGTYVNNVKVQSLQLNSSTNGTSYGAGVWTDGQFISSTSIDSNAGLQDPRTGARYCK